MLTYLIIYTAYAQLIPLTARASPFNPSLNPPSITQLLNSTTSPNTTTLSHTNTYKCTSKPEWNAPGFTVKDCESALEWLEFEEIAGSEGNRRYEFLTKDAKASKQKRRLQPTPRKYTFGTCTIGIAMTSAFRTEQLPGGNTAARFDTDTSTWKHVWETAASVFNTCVKTHRVAGWDFTGTRNSIGVFFWATGSLEDLVIEADEMFNAD